MAELTLRAQEASFYPIAELGKKKREVQEKGVELFDLGPGDDDLPIERELLSGLSLLSPGDVYSQYPTSRGTDELRGVIAQYFSKRFGVELDVSTEIIPLLGSKEGIYHFPLLFIDDHSPRKRILGPSYPYPAYTKGAVMVGATYAPLVGKPDSPFLPELSDVPEEELKETALVWLNFPHNPSGTVCDREYLKRQWEVAREYDIVLVNDECYADVYFDEPPCSLLEVAREGVVVFHSLSKRSGLTGFRSGFMAGDPALVGAFAGLRNSIGTAVPQIIQEISAKFWADPEHVKKRRETFRQRREFALPKIREIGLEPVASETTFYLWMPLPEGVKSKAYMEELIEYGVVVTPAEFFDENETGWIRASLVLENDRMEQALAIWKTHHESILQRVGKNG